MRKSAGMSSMDVRFEVAVRLVVGGVGGHDGMICRG